LRLRSGDDDDDEETRRFVNPFVVLSAVSWETIESAFHALFVPRKSFIL
jgi:hypothetical protein